MLLSVGARGAYLYAGVIVASCLGLQLSAGQGAVRVVSETVAGALAAVAGPTLAGAVRQQRDEEQALRDTNRRLHAALTDSREPALTQERARVAATLHDGLGHRLTTIGMSLDYATRMVGTSPENAVSELRRARADVSAALEEMRATVRAMKPVTLVARDILATLRQLADSFRSTALNVEFESSGPHTGFFSEEQAVLMLRFTQEALTNVVRHSRADWVLIRVSGDGVVGADNGTGNVAAEDFGLTSLRERAASLGATISVEPHGGLDGGFRIALHLGEAR
ncbi:sensor histidine kinase [Corynebacterium timonense]|uniref:sensor histidine kinase n=1 Tax=Corynebacterium timonense TaxID=441500 RepID=UPI00059494FB|nr:histidine kinase [Corynebacterium timonense]